VARSSDPSDLTRSARRHIPEGGIPHFGFNYCKRSRPSEHTGSAQHCCSYSFIANMSEYKQQYQLTASYLALQLMRVSLSDSQDEKSVPYWCWLVLRSNALPILFINLHMEPGHLRHSCGQWSRDCMFSRWLRRTTVQYIIYARCNGSQMQWSVAYGEEVLNCAHRSEILRSALTGGQSVGNWHGWAV
jgi:hypothetical protein